MKYANEICLLCKIRKADKANSHIVPKFLVKSMLGNNSKKRAYLLNTNKLAQDTKFSQDTDKVDYFFCGECEAYFSILETYYATRIHNRLKDNRYSSQFSDHFQDGLHWKVCNEVDQTMFNLFINSIIFRCAVDNIGVFRKFTLKAHDLEQTRVYLNNFHDVNQANVLSKIVELKVDPIELQFAFITCESFLDPTKNSVGIHPGHGKNDCSCFLLNEYYLFFSFGELILNQRKIFKKIANSKNDSQVKIGVTTVEQWQAMAKGLLSIVTKTAINKIVEDGNRLEVMNRLNKKQSYE